MSITSEQCSAARLMQTRCYRFFFASSCTLICDTGLLEFGSCLCFRQDIKMDFWSSMHVCLCVCKQCRLELLCRNLKFHGWSSQRSLHSAPIFRLVLKVAGNGTHQRDSHNFWGALSSNKQTHKQRTNCCRRNRVGLLLLNPN